MRPCRLAKGGIGLGARELPCMYRHREQRIASQTQELHVSRALSCAAHSALVACALCLWCMSAWCVFGPPIAHPHGSLPAHTASSCVVRRPTPQRSSICPFQYLYMVASSLSVYRCDMACAGLLCLEGRSVGRPRRLCCAALARTTEKTLPTAIAIVITSLIPWFQCAWPSGGH